eukprot:1152365-Pelagomonas_calceolata.AAC.2
MDAKAKSNHTAEDVFRLGWESTPVMGSKLFAVCVSWVVTAVPATHIIVKKGSGSSSSTSWYLIQPVVLFDVPCLFFVASCLSTFIPIFPVFLSLFLGNSPGVHLFDRAPHYELLSCVITASSFLKS